MESSPFVAFACFRGNALVEAAEEEEDNNDDDYSSSQYSTNKGFLTLDPDLQTTASANYFKKMARTEIGYVAPNQAARRLFDEGEEKIVVVDDDNGETAENSKSDERSTTSPSRCPDYSSVVATQTTLQDGKSPGRELRKSLIAEQPASICAKAPSTSSQQEVDANANIDAKGDSSNIRRVSYNMDETAPSHDHPQEESSRCVTAAAAAATRHGDRSPTKQLLKVRTTESRIIKYFYDHYFDNDPSSKKELKVKANAQLMEFLETVKATLAEITEVKQPKVLYSLKGGKKRNDNVEKKPNGKEVTSTIEKKTEKQGEQGSEETTKLLLTRLKHMKDVLEWWKFIPSLNCKLKIKPKLWAKDSETGISTCREVKLILKWCNGNQQVAEMGEDQAMADSSAGASCNTPSLPKPSDNEDDHSIEMSDGDGGHSDGLYTGYNASTKHHTLSSQPVLCNADDNHTIIEIADDDKETSALSSDAPPAPPPQPSFDDDRIDIEIIDGDDDENDRSDDKSNDAATHPALPSQPARLPESDQTDDDDRVIDITDYDKTSPASSTNNTRFATSSRPLPPPACLSQEMLPDDKGNHKNLTSCEDIGNQSTDDDSSFDDFKNTVKRSCAAAAAATTAAAVHVPPYVEIADSKRMRLDCGSTGASHPANLMSQERASTSLHGGEPAVEKTEKESERTTSSSRVDYFKVAATTLQDDALATRVIPNSLISEKPASQCPPPPASSQQQYGNNDNSHSSKNSKNIRRSSSMEEEPAANHQQEKPRRCVSATVARHGDGTPKQLLKVKTTEPRIIKYFYDHYSGDDPSKYLKIQTTAPLMEFLETAKSTLRELEKKKQAAAQDDAEKNSEDEGSMNDVEKTGTEGEGGDEKNNKLLLQLKQMRDVLERRDISGLNRTKLKIKPKSWTEDPETGGPTCTQVKLILKWGGNASKQEENHAAVDSTASDGYNMPPQKPSVDEDDRMDIKVTDDDAMQSDASYVGGKDVATCPTVPNQPIPLPEPSNVQDDSIVVGIDDANETSALSSNPPPAPLPKPTCNADHMDIEIIGDDDKQSDVLPAGSNNATKYPTPPSQPGPLSDSNNAGDDHSIINIDDDDGTSSVPCGNDLAESSEFPSQPACVSKETLSDNKSNNNDLTSLDDIDNKSSDDDSSKDDFINYLNRPCASTSAHVPPFVEIVDRSRKKKEGTFSDCGNTEVSYPANFTSQAKASTDLDGEPLRSCGLVNTVMKKPPRQRGAPMALRIAWKEMHRKVKYTDVEYAAGAQHNSRFTTMAENRQDENKLRSYCRTHSKNTPRQPKVQRKKAKTKHWQKKFTVVECAVEIQNDPKYASIVEDVRNENSSNVPDRMRRKSTTRQRSSNKKRTSTQGSKRKASRPANSSRPRSLRKRMFGTEEATAPSFHRWPNGEDGGLFFGSRRVRKLRTETKEETLEGTFLSYWLGSRLLYEDISLDGEEVDSTDVHRTINNGKFAVVSAKAIADEEHNNFKGGQRKKCLRLVYAQVDGPNIASVNLQHMLEELADFGSLPTRKVAARLELLQTPAFKFKTSPYNHALVPIRDNDIQMVDSMGQDGCGFICEELLESLLGNSLRAQKTVAVQCRMYASSGIYKGMLCRKRIRSGPRIQVNETMLKVGPSRRRRLLSEEEKRAMLVITKIGLHPNSTNEQVGRLLDPSQTNVTSDFKDKLSHKRSSKMIMRIWEANGVPKKDIEAYMEAAREPEGLRHAYVVGVSDPTCELPPGSVFVTGTSRANWKMKDIFITRSPCIEPKDARMVPIITSKPYSMSQENWDWLQGLWFGAVIFANPRPGERPLPELVASGDLDGDLYLVCWNELFLKALHTVPITDEELLLPPTEEEDKSKEKEYDPNWLEKAQELMINAAVHRDLNALISKLYMKSQAIADESDLFMHDPDAIAFARAYKKALELGKHGGKVYLPPHLHEQLPKRLGHFLVTTPEEET